VTASTRWLGIPQPPSCARHRAPRSLRCSSGLEVIAGDFALAVVMTPLCASRPSDVAPTAQAASSAALRKSSARRWPRAVGARGGLIATKVGLDWKSGQPFRNGGSKAHIVEEVEDSLRRLKTDAIDLYQVHWPGPKVPVEETAAAMAELYRSGKIRAIGVSNFTPAQMDEFRAVASPAHSAAAVQSVRAQHRAQCPAVLRPTQAHHADIRIALPRAVDGGHAVRAAAE
jgi:hypothetical protein